MIEVEKKFKLTPEDIERLTDGAEFINEKTFTDIYFDTADYSLTTKDYWLRCRDGKYELKIPLNDGKMSQDRDLDQYKELETEEEIRKVLDIKENKSFEEDLKDNGYIPFCTITTTRKKYKKNKFIIDLDTLDFGYSIGEIELMVEDESKIEEAHDEIMNFAKENNLEIAPVRGKVLEYLHRNSPSHYEALHALGMF